MDNIRVLRILEYSGPRDEVEEVVARSIHGERRIKGFVIRAATVGAYLEVLNQIEPCYLLPGQPEPEKDESALEPSIGDRFSDRARKVMRLADKQARRLNHEYIGTEHVLLGLIQEECGSSGRALRDLLHSSVTIGTVGIRAESFLESGPPILADMDVIPKTPRVASCLRLAGLFAHQLGLREIFPEHLLYGLCAETEGIAAKVLAEFGINTTSVIDYLRKQSK